MVRAEGRVVALDKSFGKKLHVFMVKQRLQRLRSSDSIKQFSATSSSDNQPQKSFLKKNSLHLSRKVKCILAVAIIAIIVISIFAFMPKTALNVEPQIIDPTTSPSPSATPQATDNQNAGSNPLSGISNLFRMVAEATQITSPKPGVVTSAQTINSTVWMKVAANAWAYYQPGRGVDPDTALPYAAGVNFKAFTDWDLGSYIQAIIDAQKIGLISVNGTWGSSERLDKVLTFLETRPLNDSTCYPFWFYDATNGQGYLTNTRYASNSVDVVDTGRLFVALNNLRNFNTSLAPRIENITLYGQNYNRTNYAQLMSTIQGCASSNSIYAYYFASGFASFWPQQLGSVPNAILTNILSTPNITVNGVSLPNAPICNEPLLGSVFELNNSDRGRLMGFMNQVYLAHEAYYNETGQFMAPSEGGSPSNDWVYEWVVGPNGEPWQITKQDQTVYYNIAPVLYNKVAFGFLSLYNTTFARSLVISLETVLPDPANGYYDGADTNGVAVPGGGTNIGNTLILDAAVYAIQK
jgi:hypothetical protein